MNFIDINKEWPNHQETVLACSKKGFCVVVFINSVNMNQELERNGYSNEKVDIKKHPYYFSSQEIKGNTLNNVTHWVRLPENPSCNG